ncbi:MAG: 3-methyl-2-oxobutanoate hydroxymethyltransferase [Alphaproteobacteria bacterium]|nr:3-methyl-2-oxobutanoate hydroxymethyltransferase [Alphaproteobacteria bacterium]|tara:strand:+ start:364 stop:1155 length:792 start_codon:yes stop_codon:yes gene_type:complete
MFLDKKRQKILKKVSKKEPLICLTSYTAPIAEIADKFADIILVGDSVGPVLYGLESTKDVDLDMMIKHAKAVVKKAQKTFIVVDMPFGTYEKNKDLAYRNAKKIISETGADAVKLEGGQKISSVVKHLTEKGIVVIGHIGMLPQSYDGKYKVYGKNEAQKKQIMKDLNLLQNSGVFLIVLECVIEKLAQKIICKSDVPIIGIGASKDCHGQILVVEDLLGLTNFESKFLKKYVNLKKIISDSISKFSKEVVRKKYPSNKHMYK